LRGDTLGCVLTVGEDEFKFAADVSIDEIFDAGGVVPVFAVLTGSGADTEAEVLGEGDDELISAYYRHLEDDRRRKTD